MAKIGNSLCIAFTLLAFGASKAEPLSYYVKELDLAEELLKRFGPDAETKGLVARIDRAQTLFMLQRFAEVVETLATIVDRSDLEQFANIGDIQWLYAESLFKSGELERANSYFQKMIAGGKFKDLQLPFMRMLQIEVQRRDLKAFDAALAQHIQRFKKVSPEVHFLRGKLLFLISDFEKARIELEKVSSEPALWAKSQYMLASAAAFSKNTELSLKLLNDLESKLSPTEDAELKRLVALAKGRICYEADQFDCAIKSYESALQSQKNRGVANLELALVYARRASKQQQQRRQDHKKALSLLQTVFENKTDDIDQLVLWTALANLRQKVGNFARAQEILQRLQKSWEAVESAGNAASIDHERAQNFLALILSDPDSDSAKLWLRQQPQVRRIIGLNQGKLSLHNELLELEALQAQLASQIEKHFLHEALMRVRNAEQSLSQLVLIYYEQPKAIEVRQACERARALGDALAKTLDEEKQKLHQVLSAQKIAHEALQKKLELLNHAIELTSILEVKTFGSEVANRARTTVAPLELALGELELQRYRLTTDKVRAEEARKSKRLKQLNDDFKSIAGEEQ